VLLLLLASVFVYSSHGKWVFPPLLWSFPPYATLTSFLAPGFWAHAAAPALSGQARLVYLQFWEGFHSTPLWRSGCPTLFAMCLYYSYCLLLSFFFLPWVGVGLSRGLCCSGPGLSVGVPHTAQLTLWSASSQAVWAQASGCGPGASGFSVQCEVEMLCSGWRCGGVKVLPLLGGLACKVCLQHLSKISFRRYAFCFLPLATILQKVIYCNDENLVVEDVLQFLSLSSSTGNGFCSMWPDLWLIDVGVGTWYKLGYIFSFKRLKYENNETNDYDFLELDHFSGNIFFLSFFLIHLFICAYIVWAISPPYPLPTPSPHCPASLPGRTCFALISNFVEERV
jgi:hypothetical protein